MAERAVMTQASPFVPGLLADRVATGIAGDEVRPAEEPLDLAAQAQFEFRAAPEVDRELDTR